MAHLSGTDRLQLLLLPEAVDDYVGQDNPVRFIEAFADGLDLAAAGFVRVTAKETGRVQCRIGNRYLAQACRFRQITRRRSHQQISPTPAAPVLGGNLRFLNATVVDNGNLPVPARNTVRAGHHRVRQHPAARRQGRRVRRPQLP
jgi:hypothetical protein